MSKTAATNDELTETLVAVNFGDGDKSLRHAPPCYSSSTTSADCLLPDVRRVSSYCSTNSKTSTSSSGSFLPGTSIGPSSDDANYDYKCNDHYQDLAFVDVEDAGPEEGSQDFEQRIVEIGELDFDQDEMPGNEEEMSVGSIGVPTMDRRRGRRGSRRFSFECHGDAFLEAMQASGELGLDDDDQPNPNDGLTAPTTSKNNLQGLRNSTSMVSLLALGEDDNDDNTNNRPTSILGCLDRAIINRESRAGSNIVRRQSNLNLRALVGNGRVRPNRESPTSGGCNIVRRQSEITLRDLAGNGRVRPRQRRKNDPALAAGALTAAASFLDNQTTFRSPTLPPPREHDEDEDSDDGAICF